MGTSRRTAVGKLPNSKADVTSRVEPYENDTIHVNKPDSRSNIEAAEGPSAQRSTPEKTPSSTDDRDDVTISSATVTETADRDATISPAPIDKFKEGSEIAKPSATPWPVEESVIEGTVRNPIDLSESPPRKVHASTERELERLANPAEDLHLGQQMPEPQGTRRPLAPKPVAGNTFTGHRQDDMSRMMKAKNDAHRTKVPELPAPAPASTPAASQRLNTKVPFHVSYPLSAAYLAQNSQPTPPVQRPRARYTRCSPHNRYPPDMTSGLHTDSESKLVAKAAQLVREQGRPQAFRRQLEDERNGVIAGGSNANVSGSKKRPASSPSAAAMMPPPKKLNVFMDTPVVLVPLIAQNAVMTNLLRAYLNSPNPTHLREDIARLASTQSSCMKDWLEQEEKREKEEKLAKDQREKEEKREEEQRRAREMTTVMNQTMTEEENQRKERDEQVRSMLNSDAEIWGDKTGQGLVEVFASGAAENEDAANEVGEGSDSGVGEKTNEELGNKDGKNN